MKKIIVLLTIGFVLISGISVSAISKHEINSIPPGDYFRFLNTDGRLRSYRLHIPPNYNVNIQLPLVLCLHGDGFPAVNSYTHKHYYASDMDSKADEEGFILVYPNGGFFLYKYLVDYPLFLSFVELFPILTFSRQWNHWNTSKIDDVGFIHNLINHLRTTLTFNNSRIYITGLSGGAMMTYQLGSELSEIIAAIAPVAGASGGINTVSEPDNSLPIYTVPKPDKPMPIMILYGMNDPSYNGGWLNFLNFGPYQSWGYLLSAEESVSLWVEYNNCNDTPEITESENGRIITKKYQNTNTNADVVYVTYLDGGHEWFKSPPYEESATDLIWDFFERHPKT